MYLVFDTETTGLPKNFRAPASDIANWPRMVQLAWQVCDVQGNLLESENVLIFPEGFEIPEEATTIHGITTQRARDEGVPLRDALERFARAIDRAECVVAHNVAFDTPIVLAESFRCDMGVSFESCTPVCTMKSTAQFCGIRNRFGFKWPKLEELHYKLFGCSFEGAHDAKVDVEMCKKCFFELQRRGVL